MLTYRFNTKVMELVETENEKDVEFRIRLLEPEPYVEGLKRIRQFFEDNEVYTDVLFYAYPNHEYIVNVRKDYYIDFILALFKNKLLESVEWAAS